MDLTSWIDDYEAYLQSNGYASRLICSRLKHLRCLARFVGAMGLSMPEEFGPTLTADFIDYWVHHQPWAKTSAGYKRKSTYEPHHHIGVHYSLRCFFRWAYTTGRLQQNIFPRRPLVRGNYGFPAVADYLRFCQEHKGLAENSLLQIELFVRRFDQFLRQHLNDWNQMRSGHIDLFVRQQAGRNIKRIQRVHKVLRGLFRYLFSLGLLDRDWGSALHSPRQYCLAHVPRVLSPGCDTHSHLSCQLGESPAYVQRQLGHSSIKMTVDTYGKWLPAGNREAVNRLDEAPSAAVREG